MGMMRPRGRGRTILRDSVGLVSKPSASFSLLGLTDFCSLVLLALGVFLFAQPSAFLLAAEPTRGRTAGLMTAVGAWMLSSGLLMSNARGEKGVIAARAGGGEAMLFFGCRARLLLKQAEPDVSMLERRDLVLLPPEEQGRCDRGYGDGRLIDLIEEVRERTRRGYQCGGRGT